MLTVCNACSNTGFKREGDRVTRCEACYRRKVLEGRQRQLTEHFAKFTVASVANYTPSTPTQKSTVDVICKYPGSSFYITGQMGHGKTHLLIAQFKLAPVEQRCLLRTSQQLVAELRRSELDPEFSSPVRSALDSRTLHLFWDDCDKLSFDKSSFREEAIFELIDEISRQELPITITSNLDPNELQTVRSLQPAVARRLADMCVLVRV